MLFSFRSFFGHKERDKTMRQTMAFKSGSFVLVLTLSLGVLFSVKNVRAESDLNEAIKQQQREQDHLRRYGGKSNKEKINEARKEHEEDKDAAQKAQKKAAKALLNPKGDPDEKQRAIDEAAKKQKDRVESKHFLEYLEKKEEGKDHGSLPGNDDILANLAADASYNNDANIGSSGTPAVAVDSPPSACPPPTCGPAPAGDSKLFGISPHPSDPVKGKNHGMIWSRSGKKK